MDRDSFDRQERRMLRQLAGLAWERELASELTQLSDAFAAWRAGQLGPHELSDRIHEFHNGAARDLYGLYTRVHPSQLVARAIGRGLVSDRDAPSSLVAKLAKSVEFYRAEESLLESDEGNDTPSHEA
jgi:hypothetical protein